MAGDKLFYIGAKALIENGAGEILLLKTSDRPGLAIKESYWDFPGGRLKPGQTPSQALKEEILEETGINDITETGLWTTVVSNHVTYKDDNEIGLSLLVYRVSIPAGSQIVPLRSGDAAAAMELSKALRKQGFFVPGIRPPSVPVGQSLLRFSLTWGHEVGMLSRVVEAVGRPA